MTAQLRAAVCALALPLLAACGGGSPEGAADSGVAEREQPAVGVVLNAEQLAKLGVQIGEVQGAVFQPRVDGPARVVDAQTVVGVMAELGRAEAQARTSQTAVKRARDLFGNGAAVSAETLEAAERQAAADDAQLRVARARASLTFGAAAPWLDAARRESVLGGLAAGSLVLVSASFPSGLPTELPTALELRRVGAASAATWSASELWPGPADPSVPGPTVLALLSMANGLVSGERLIASVATGAPLAGTVVPVPAVVLAGGEPWCYVQADDGLVRRRVDLGRPLAPGYFQERGFAAGERVVVAGAGLLLAREIGGGEED